MVGYSCCDIDDLGIKFKFSISALSGYKILRQVKVILIFSVESIYNVDNSEVFEPILH